MQAATITADSVTDVQKPVPQDVQNIRLMAQMIQRSREEFQIQLLQKDVEEALKQSMAENYQKPTGSTALYK